MPPVPAQDGSVRGFDDVWTGFLRAAKDLSWVPLTTEGVLNPECLSRVSHRSVMVGLLCCLSALEPFAHSIPGWVLDVDLSGLIVAEFPTHEKFAMAGQSTDYRCGLQTQQGHIWVQVALACLYQGLFHGIYKALSKAIGLGVPWRAGDVLNIPCPGEVPECLTIIHRPIVTDEMPGYAIFREDLFQELHDRGAVWLPGRHLSHNQEFRVLVAHE